jgi:hypothetical protein
VKYRTWKVLLGCARYTACCVRTYGSTEVCTLSHKTCAKHVQSMPPVSRTYHASAAMLLARACIAYKALTCVRMLHASTLLRCRTVGFQPTGQSRLHPLRSRIAWCKVRRVALALGKVGPSHVNIFIAYMHSLKTQRWVVWCVLAAPGLRRLCVVNMCTRQEHAEHAQAHARPKRVPALATSHRDCVHIHVMPTQEQTREDPMFCIDHHIPLVDLLWTCHGPAMAQGALLRSCS